MHKSAWRKGKIKADERILCHLAPFLQITSGKSTISVQYLLSCSDFNASVTPFTLPCQTLLFFKELSLYSARFFCLNFHLVIRRKKSTEFQLSKIG